MPAGDELLVFAPRGVELLLCLEVPGPSGAARSLQAIAARWLLPQPGGGRQEHCRQLAGDEPADRLEPEPGGFADADIEGRLPVTT